MGQIEYKAKLSSAEFETVLELFRECVGTGDR